jgi:hypothetical protein
LSYRELSYPDTPSIDRVPMIKVRETFILIKAPRAGLAVGTRRLSEPSALKYIRVAKFDTRD